MKPQLEHANLTVPDIDATARFLQTAMPEFRVRGRGGDGGYGAERWLHVGTDETYVALNENPVSPGANFHHLGFVVEDASEVGRRLKAAGYREGYKNDPHPERVRVYFEDGSGLEWEFVSYASADPARRNRYGE